jgi:urease accessory protein
MTHTGYLHLEAESKGNKTIITNSFFDGILKITRPAYLQNELPLLTLIHVGGGYVDGDSYLTEVVVGETARLALTTQASTKVYKCPRYGVKQSADYFLKTGSELYVKQDSLIPYKGASFTQTANVYMSSTAVFYYTDIITPGWSKDGELFAYKKVATKMKIFVDGSLEVFDHLLLEPTGKLRELMGLEGFTHIGTMFFIHPNISPKLAEELRENLKDYKDIRIGISILNVKGVSIRILANQTPKIETVISKCESYLREKLYNEEEIEWRKG